MKRRDLLKGAGATLSTLLVASPLSLFAQDKSAGLPTRKNPPRLEAMTEENINNSNYFPDDNFRGAVVELMGSDYFTTEQAASKDGTLDCHERGIESIAGIEYLSSLDDLDCRANNLTTLDLSKNHGLVSCQAGNNLLTSVQVSKWIRFLYVGDNQLESLDVSHCFQLQSLAVLNNHLREIRLPEPCRIENLYLQGNELTELRIASSYLELLYCGGNPLRELDITLCPGLEFLHCWPGELTKLDLSGNGTLRIAELWRNKLTELRVPEICWIEYINVSENELRDVSSLAEAKWLANPCIDLRYNHLRKGSEDLQALVGKVGHYPQTRDFPPMEGYGVKYLPQREAPTAVMNWHDHSTPELRGPPKRGK